MRRLSIVPKAKSPEVHASYLPSYDLKLPKTNPNDVRVFDINYKTNKLYKEDMEKSIGAIRASIVVDNHKDFDELCHQNVMKAIDLAAEHGANEIKYVCMYPQGELSPLSSVGLQAFAFKD